MKNAEAKTNVTKRIDYTVSVICMQLTKLFAE